MISAFAEVWLNGMWIPVGHYASKHDLFAASGQGEVLPARALSEDLLGSRLDAFRRLRREWEAKCQAAASEPWP